MASLYYTYSYLEPTKEMLKYYLPWRVKSLTRRPHIVAWNWDTDWLLNTCLELNLLENKNGLYFRGIICGSNNSLAQKKLSVNQNMLVFEVLLPLLWLHLPILCVLFGIPVIATFHVNGDMHWSNYFKYL